MRGGERFCVCGARQRRWGQACCCCHGDHVQMLPQQWEPAGGASRSVAQREEERSPLYRHCMLHLKLVAAPSALWVGSEATWRMRGELSAF